MRNRLSNEERDQLGTSNYPTAQQWSKIRRVLVARSQATARRNGYHLPERMTAYTPGETIALMKEPEIEDWLDRMKSFRVPSGYRSIVFVPCAKTKPWEGPGCEASKYYVAYNEIRSEYPSVYFATISEPLGIVPQDAWSDFPAYDDPGLFRDSASRSDMVFTRDWPEVFGMPAKRIPFGKRAYAESIATLAVTIAAFAKTNSRLPAYCFVDKRSGGVTSHGDMIDAAQAMVGHDFLEGRRFEKSPSRGASVEEIKEHILNNL